jgi:hypothetical protein
MSLECTVPDSGILNTSRQNIQDVSIFSLLPNGNAVNSHIYVRVHDINHKTNYTSLCHLCD